MKRILFVDDEPKILEGLRRSLRAYRKDWEMEFEGDPVAALEMLEDGSFDVVVSDLVMPGMDGATLLGQVRDEHPGCVRIVLTGHAELQSALRIVPVAHRYLGKPCEGGELGEAIERSCDLHALLEDPSLRAIVGGMSSLPSVPRVYQELTEALTDPEVSLDDVAAIVEQDVGITAKVLQLVNSSMFGIAQDVETVRKAATFLGTSMIRALALSIEVFEACDGGQTPPSFSIEQEQSHSTLTARIARRLLTDREDAAQAFLAAMLHDVGRLVIATQLPDAFEEIMAEEVDQGQLAEVEERVLGISHAELGAYLLGIWGMPHSILEAVAHHHAPSRAGTPKLDVLCAVHVADALARDAETGEIADELTASRWIDPAYVDAIATPSQQAEWISIARHEAGLLPTDDQ